MLLALNITSRKKGSASVCGGDKLKAVNRAKMAEKPMI